MPKMKTHKGTKKRFRLSAKGKPKHRHSGTSHLATRKTHKQKRNLRGTAVVKTVEGQKIRTALAHIVIDLHESKDRTPKSVSALLDLANFAGRAGSNASGLEGPGFPL